MQKTMFVTTCYVTFRDGHAHSSRRWAYKNRAMRNGLVAVMIWNVAIAKWWRLFPPFTSNTIHRLILRLLNKNLFKSIFLSLINAASKIQQSSFQWKLQVNTTKVIKCTGTNCLEIFVQNESHKYPWSVTVVSKPY